MVAAEALVAVCAPLALVEVAETLLAVGAPLALVEVAEAHLALGAPLAESPPADHIPLVWM